MQTTGSVAGMSEIGATPAGLDFFDNGNGTATIGGTAQGVIGAYASSTTSTLTIDAASASGAGQPDVPADGGLSGGGGADLQQRQLDDVHAGHAQRVHSGDDGLPDSGVERERRAARRANVHR